MTYPEQSDEELVALTLAGNLQAYEKLVVRHQRNVIASAYSIAHDHFMAEDAAQDAFVAAWMKLALLKCPSKYGPWVCRISANRARNMLAGLREYMDIELLDYAGMSMQPDMAEGVIGREERKMLREVVEKLPERTREAILMHYYEGLSIKDIAKKAQISSGTVKWQLHEGRRKLRKELCAMEGQENKDLLRKQESTYQGESEAWRERGGEEKDWEEKKGGEEEAQKERGGEEEAWEEKKGSEDDARKERKDSREEVLEGLSERVMRRVEEIRLWRLGDKGDFQKQFGDSLEEIIRDLEGLPESEEKYFILADVLQEAWDWMPGMDSEECFARKKEAAIKGRNEEVIDRIMAEESKGESVKEISLLMKKRIPFLKKHGFLQSLGRERFWLGYKYFRKGDKENGFLAYDRALSTLKPADLYYAFALMARQAEQVWQEKNVKEDRERHMLRASGEEYRLIEGVPRRWLQPSYDFGHCEGLEGVLRHVFQSASGCDHYFYIPGLKVGETYTGTNGSTLAFAGENLCVTTPCGTFDGCQCWIAKSRAGACRSYYKQGIGLVRQESLDGDGYAVLKFYQIEGGQGLIPWHGGNRWEYELASPEHAAWGEEKIQVTYADEEKIVLGYYSYGER